MTERNKAAIDILRSEFTRRSRRNARYSLRAFAKSLGVSHTVLSLAMSGRRPFSKRSIRLLVEQLELKPEISARLLGDETMPFMHKASDYDFIELEKFDMISDWVHYAILSLLEVPNAKFEAKWVAQRLNINEMQARVAMNRLVSLQLVEQKSDRRWRQTGKPIKVENSTSTAATKKFHRQLLEKALESLDLDPPTERDFSSMTMAIDPDQIDHARKRIREFRRELTAELEARGSAKEVYNLTVQIYPVSRGGKK